MLHTLLFEDSALVQEELLAAVSVEVRQPMNTTEVAALMAETRW